MEEKRMEQKTNRITKLTEKLSRHRVCLICAVLGGFTFLMIYGAHILNPSYTDWLFHGPDGDLTQHYLGWKFFREDSFHFPIGIMENIAWPNRVSVIFTDSIPVLAVFFKLFRFLLPEQFQYFGWWGLLCFVLQALFASKILKKYMGSDIASVLGSLFFVLAPVLIDRMYWMTSLSAHWLCLMGIWFIADRETLCANRGRAVSAWTLLGILCASIHLYFLPMCGILLAGFCLADIGKTKKGWNALFCLLGYLGGAVLTVWLLGGFSSNMGAAYYGLGDYSFNLNGFFNPTGRFAFWSRILPARPQYIDNQYEGFAYLGFGALLLLFVTVTQLLGSVTETLTTVAGRFMSGKGRPMGESHSREKKGEIRIVLIWILMFLLSVIAAASPVITWNEKILASLPIPGVLRSVWEMFRASGRLVWPALYILLFFAVLGDRRQIKKEVKLAVLACCLLFQIYDMKDVLAVKRETFKERTVKEQVLTTSSWKSLAENDGIRHIVFLSDFVPDRRLLYSFGDCATDYGMTINDFYFARPMGDAVEKERQAALKEGAEDTVFVRYRNESQLCIPFPAHYYELDGLIVGCTGPLTGMEELTVQDLSTYRFNFSSGPDVNRYVNNGEDVDGVRRLHSYGNSYGPYLKAEPGTYRVTVTGSGLTAATLECHYKKMGDPDSQIPLEILNAQTAEDRITYEVRLEERTDSLEFLIWNTGADDMLLHGVEIVKVLD